MSVEKAKCRNCGEESAAADLQELCCQACVSRGTFFGEMVEEEEANLAARTVWSGTDGYTTGARLGRGGMGTVYLARRVSDKVMVAVKFIHAELTQRPRLKSQFLNESAALAELDHPNIVRHLDAGEVAEGKETQPFIVMEYVQGSDLGVALRNKAKAKAQFGFEEILGYGKAITAGLAAAHAQGFIHRDVKPSNVLTTLDDDGAADGGAKIADFGLVTGGKPDREVLLATWNGSGSYYASPELENGLESDHRTDLYSLGVVLLHLLTMKAPKNIPKRPSEIVPSVDGGSGRQREAMKRLILSLVSEEPANRPATAAEVEHELVKIAQGRFWTLSWRQNLRRLAAVLLVAGTAAAGWYWRQERTMSEKDKLAMQLPGAVFLQRDRVGVPLPRQPGFPHAVRFENSLGMKFREFPRHDALGCVWETRVVDYKAHAADTPKTGIVEWLKETGFEYRPFTKMIGQKNREYVVTNQTWRNPDWEIADNQPVVGVSFQDAAGFCMWLTWKERKAGVIGQNEGYRLPTDEEWSAMAGLPVEEGTTPMERDITVQSSAHYWCWGPEWPPRAGFANLGGVELDELKVLPMNWVGLASRDDWPYVAPVEGAIPSSGLGFYHISGNVSEWTESPWKIEGDNRLYYTARGGSWITSTPQQTSLNDRGWDGPAERKDTRGFRVVFDRSGAEGWHYTGKK